MKLIKTVFILLTILMVISLGSCDIFGVQEDTVESTSDSSQDDSENNEDDNDSSSTTDTSSNSNDLGWEFDITSSSYHGSTNWTNAVQNELGSSYEVADWTDLEDYYNDGNNILDLFDSLGLTDQNDSAFVTRNGDQIYYSSRYYFAA